jgi:four helix bundle protein
VATFKGFEEIDAWKRARELTRRVYEVTAHGAFSRDFVLRDQLRRACVSIMSNVAEGHGRGGRKEFLQFLSMALGSANEVCSQLYVALDQGYITDREFRSLADLAQETSNLIGGLARYLRTSPVSGPKFLTSCSRTRNHKPETTYYKPETTSHKLQTTNQEP